MAHRPDAEADTEAIRARLIEGIARAVGVPPERIDVDRPFMELGVSSHDATALTGELGVWLGRAISPLVVWDFPTIDALARHLGGELDSPLDA